MTNFLKNHSNKINFQNGDSYKELAWNTNYNGLPINFPFIITSGYRSLTHPIEAKKDVPGTHAQGIAADIKVNNAAERYTIIKNALELGFTGLGVASTFIHVDTRGSAPVLWLY